MCIVYCTERCLWDVRRWVFGDAVRDSTKQCRLWPFECDHCDVQIDWECIGMCSANDTRKCFVCWCYIEAVRFCSQATKAVQQPAAADHRVAITVRVEQGLYLLHNAW